MRARCRIALVVALLMLTACEEPKPAPEPVRRCINGVLHREWSPGLWVQEDGRRYLYQPDGPIPCVESKKGNGNG